MLTKEQGDRLIEAAAKGKWRLRPVTEAKAKALNGAMNSYAQQARQEEVLAFYDTTVFGGGKNGFLLTSGALYHDSFPFQLKDKGTTTRLPLAGIKNVRAVQGDKYRFTIRYQDGSKITIFTSPVHQDGLRALLNAAIREEKKAAAEETTRPEPEPAAAEETTGPEPESAAVPEQNQAGQTDEKEQLLAEYQAKLAELTKAG
ncbi:MAG: hypothetical protein LUF34_03695 [Lachnospiraceae bacterium]|nr:hypothetical protein [Lachnospiraceae bacterium]